MYWRLNEMSLPPLTDAIVVLPYTRVKRCASADYRMSHFTARRVLAGLRAVPGGRCDVLCVARRATQPLRRRMECVPFQPRSAAAFRPIAC